MYRANKHVYLPKFGWRKIHSSRRTRRNRRTGSGNHRRPNQKSRHARCAKTQKLPAWTPGPVRATFWASKLNPISMWRGSAPAAPSAPCPVQSELSLDSVKSCITTSAMPTWKWCRLNRARRTKRPRRCCRPRKNPGISGRADVSRNHGLNQRQTDAQCWISFTKQ